MSRTHPDIPVLELSGTPGQIGAAHGEALRERIREYADRFIGWVLRASVLNLTEETLWTHWSPQVAVNQAEAPALVEEMRGIARGAGVPFERIFLLNSLLDLMSFRYVDMARNFAGGCSTFAVVAEAGTGRTLLGQTYDLHEFHQDFVTLLRIKPPQGPRQLIYTYAGIVGAAGLNEAGVGVTINYLSPTDVGLGKLHSVVVRQILAGEQLADALTSPVMPPRAGGAHFMVADAGGHVISIETTARRQWIAYPQSNAIGHTNHYLAAWLKDSEQLRPGSIGGSIARHAALSRFFDTHGDKMSVERLQELTRDHNAHPRSICAHGASCEPVGEKTRTIAALVQVLADRVMHITRGCACENPYHAVDL
jgi:isopenicillin-N N-acyltransferase-like protein